MSHCAFKEKRVQTSIIHHMSSLAYRNTLCLWSGQLVDGLLYLHPGRALLFVYVCHPGILVRVHFCCFFCQCAAIYREPCPPSGLSNCFGLRAGEMARSSTHANAALATREAAQTLRVVSLLVSVVGLKKKATRKNSKRLLRCTYCEDERNLKVEHTVVLILAAWRRAMLIWWLFETENSKKFLIHRLNVFWELSLLQYVLLN